MGQGRPQGSGEGDKVLLSLEFLTSALRAPCTRPSTRLSGLWVTFVIQGP